MIERRPIAGLEPKEPPAVPMMAPIPGSPSPIPVSPQARAQRQAFQSMPGTNTMGALMSSTQGKQGLLNQGGVVGDVADTLHGLHGHQL